MGDINTPLISVVFTSYNHATYLRQAVESILNQTYKNFELIIVDDCSTDQSQSILKEYQEDSRVRLNLLEKNTGSYVKASNYGAKLAKGEYLLFAQCDDFAHSEQLETLLKAIDQKDIVGVVYSRSNMVDSNGIVFEDDFRGRERAFRKYCSADTFIAGTLMRRFLSYSCVIPNLSAALIRRSLYEKVGGISEKYLVAADWAFWLTMSENTSFYYISTPLNNFRQHATTIRNTIKMQKQIIEIYELMHEHIQKFQLSKREKLHFRIGMGQVWFSYIFSGLSHWLKSFSNVYKESKKIEKYNILFLFIGFLFYCKQLIYQRIRV
jgi:glycosyltransferase involved in cell wall biosynthesis